MSSNILNEFREALSERCIASGFSSETWAEINFKKPNLIKVNSPLPFILYVKVRGDVKGFWGVTKNRIDELENSGLPWCLVLLAGKPYSGFVLSKRQVMERVGLKRWTLGKDGDFKVNQKADLAPNGKLNTSGQLFGVIL